MRVNIIKAEPVLLLDLLKAAILCAVTFGLPLSDGQTNALLGLATAFLALSGLARQAVTPMAKVNSLATEIGGNANKLANRLAGGEE